MISVEQIDKGFYRLSDPLDFMCYLVIGSQRAVLVDTMCGFGNVREVVTEVLAKEGLHDLPLEVVLTHHHIDHCGGAYWFDHVYMPHGEDGHWKEIEQHGASHMAAAVEDGTIDAKEPWSLRDGSRPKVSSLTEGDTFELGDRCIYAVSLPGHTAASMGFLCPEMGILLAGDAVTPIMCLCFEDSLSIEEWQHTLTKMQDLSFERFYTGHHRHGFTKADLGSFQAAGEFAKTDRGIEWHHAVIPGWEGTCHFCPRDTLDVDSPNFRAVITHGIPARRDLARTA